MNSKRLFDGVIFDLGGTLIFYEGAGPPITSRADLALFNSLQQAGLHLDRDDFLQKFRSQMDAYYRERESEFIEYTSLYVLRTLLAGWGYPDLSDEILKPALKAMFAVTQAYWQPEADAIPMLETLQKQGYRLGLISNASDAEDVHTLVGKAGFGPYLHPVLTSAEVGVRKPNPVIFHKLLNQWGILPQRAVMVGDTLGADILGARNAGVTSIWITRRANTPANQAHADTIKPDVTIEMLSDLPGLLEHLVI